MIPDDESVVSPKHVKHNLLMQDGNLYLTLCRQYVGQTGSVTRPASYPRGTGCKAAGASS
jgi:hypothetical protein